MKRVLLVSSMFAMFMHAHAQIATLYAGNDVRPKAMGRNVSSIKRNEFEQVRIFADNRHIFFTGLPHEKRTILAYLTNMEGEIIKEMKVSPQDNIKYMHRLHGTYFVTLVYKDKNRKAVVIQL